MEDAARVHVLEASQYLVDEKLDVLITDGLARLYDLAEIGLH